MSSNSSVVGSESLVVGIAWYVGDQKPDRTVT